MHAQTTDTSSFQVMVLTDADTMLDAATTFVRSIAGEDAQVMMVPFNGECGCLEHTAPGDGTARADGGEPVDAPGAAALAQQRGVDLIVMATTCDPHGVVDPACGVAQLALDSPVPVMLLRSHEPQPRAFAPITRLLVPLDGSSRAAQALPFATRLARRLQLPVEFVMVIDPSRVLPPAYAYDPEAMDGAIIDLRETAHWALKQAERQLAEQGVAVESVLLYGPVVTCIESAIEPGDLVLMTTHGTGRSLGNRLGSVAARMVANVDVPLVIMRGQRQGDVVVEGYVACPWVEPLSGRTVTANA